MADLYNISMTIEVRDPEELREAATQRMIEEGLSPDAAAEFCGEIGNCLIGLADPGLSWPGTQIQESVAEHLTTY